MIEAFVNVGRNITPLCAPSAARALSVPKQSDCGAAPLEGLTQKAQNYTIFQTKNTVLGNSKWQQLTIDCKEDL